jgi:predicted phosphate transport protein (TIGR00153 family)
MFLERSGEMANIFQKLIPYRSPLELLSEHSKLCVKAANLMYTAVEKYLNNTSVDDLSKEVDKLEHAADQLKLQLRNIYSKLKWTYFNKADFLDILHNVDSIIDLTDDVVKVLTINQIDHVPEDIKAPVQELTDTVRKSVEHMDAIIQELKTVVESGFAPKEIEKEDQGVETVEAEERSSDKLGLELGKKLFAKKNEMNPVDIMFLNNVVILLMRIEDRARNVVERIRMITHS